MNTVKLNRMDDIAEDALANCGDYSDEQILEWKKIRGIIKGD